MQSGFGFIDVDSDNGLPCAVVAFGALADELAKYSKGSTIRVSGQFKANNYTKQDGTEVEGWQITADGIAGVKSARGRYSTPKQNSQQAKQASAEFQDSAIPANF